MTQTKTETLFNTKTVTGKTYTETSFNTTTLAGKTYTETSINTTTVTTTSFVTHYLQSETSSSETNVTAIVLGVVIPIAVIILALILIWFYFKRKRIFQKKELDKFIVSQDPMNKNNSVIDGGAICSLTTNIKLSEQVNPNTICLKFEEQEIADEVLAVKLEKEKEHQENIFMEGTEDVQKGIGLKSDIMSSSKKVDQN